MAGLQLFQFCELGDDSWKFIWNNNLSLHGKGFFFLLTSVNLIKPNCNSVSVKSKQAEYNSLGYTARM